MESRIVKHEETTRRRNLALLAALLSIVSAGSYTTLAGLLATNFAVEFGWSVSVFSVGVGINMALYGLTAPFAIFAMQRLGIRQVSILALVTLALGGVLCMIPNLLLFTVSWGLLVGLGTGCLTMAYGALFARTWFPGNQGTVVGLLTASAVVGQFALLPGWAAAAATFGWRAPLLGCTVLAALAIAANALFMKDEGPSAPTRPSTSISIASSLLQIFYTLLDALKTGPFWALATLFFVCGATTNGLLWSHFTPAANDVGMSPILASSVLFLVGIFNVAGTISAGWLTDRISPRLILSFVFFARAATLLWLPLILASDYSLEIVAFGILFGILDVATVPPVITLCNRVFGQDGPAIFGWINAVHQIGAGFMALSGGIIRSEYGSYHAMWIIASILCFGATFIVYSSRYRQPQTV